MTIERIIVKMKKILTLLMMLVSVITYGQGKIIYQENFDKHKKSVSLKELGWNVVSKPGHSTYTVKDGKLYVKITPNRYRDGYAEIEVPVCRKGQLDFDVLIDPDRINPKGVGLTLDLYNISTYWHDYCRDWRLYFPEPTVKRMDGFSVEPVGHKPIGYLKKGKWIHYRICFDTDNDRVECYLNKMDDPAYIKGDAPVLGRAEYQGGKLRVGSFGICSGAYRAVIDNIVLRDLDNETASSGDEKKDLYLLFRGISFDFYKIGPALCADGVKPENIRNYDLDFWRSSYFPENTFKYQNFPGTSSFNRAKSIVLIDAPCGPEKILPEFLQKDIMKTIHSGSKLVIFGGLFTLGKGEYQGTALERILPVELKGVWQVKSSNTPLSIKVVNPEFKKINWSKKPCVYHYHDLKPTKDAKILLKAGDKPLLVSRKFGKGEVIVFLGTVCGPPSENPPIFWKWKDWPKLVKKIVE